MLPKYEETAALFARYSLPCDREMYEKLGIYADFLIQYNQNVNLTAITDPKEILVKHFLDSMLPLRFVTLPQGASLLDVGSGAGFPSVPMLLMRPDMQVTLLDSLQKRIVFLEQLGERLGVHLSCVHARAEDAAKLPEYREKFDVVTARAVASMPVLTEYCLPFVRMQGIFLALKGPSEAAENCAHAAQLLGSDTPEIVDYALESEGRRLFILRKISQTSTKFPRNSSQIKRAPLIKA